ncbi:MAG: hypothetical protein L0228_04845 [Planctomycetes bacterium]|nr:hypothetical protein [Planctomycetota bacterium]
MTQRSPIIVWLLVAASLCVCTVALSWVSESSPRSVYGAMVYYALLNGHLSAVCIWSALRTKTNVWTRIAPLVAVIAFSIAFGLVDPDINNYLFYFGLHAAALLTGLWVFRRSRYWERRSGDQSDWQFSIGQLLIITTVVALLAAALHHSELQFDGDHVLLFAFLCCSVALAMASVFIWSRVGHWLLRLAGVLAVAFGLGAAFYISDEYMAMFAMIHYLIQGLVLSAWLTWGQILPINEAPVVAESYSRPKQ